MALGAIPGARSTSSATNDRCADHQRTVNDTVAHLLQPLVDEELSVVFYAPTTIRAEGFHTPGASIACRARAPQRLDRQTRVLEKHPIGRHDGQDVART